MRKPEIIGVLSTTSHPQIALSVEAAMRVIPPEIRTLLKGYRTRIARRIVDIDLAEAATKITGYSGKVAAYASGRHCLSAREIWLAQEQMDDEHGCYRPAWSNRFQVYLHEIGHAFDRSSEDGVLRSASALCREAYAKDMLALGAMDIEAKSGLIEQNGYFLSACMFERGAQPDEHEARKEAFAEAFSTVLGGFGCHYDGESAREHARLFVNFYRAVEAEMCAISPAARFYPEAQNVYPACAEPKALVREFSREFAGESDFAGQGRNLEDEGQAQHHINMPCLLP